MELDGQIRSRADNLVWKGIRVLDTHSENPSNVIGFPTLDTQKYAEWRSQALAFLTDFVGPEHTYTESFRKSTEKSGHTASTQAGIGILQAVLEDIDRGYIKTIRRLIAAETLHNLFEQAEHLLENGYIPAAASLAGAALENGLRAIASRSGIPVKDGDDLSSLSKKLADKSVYTRLVQKEVAVWTTVRNSADHGKFDNITHNDVAKFIREAGSFLAGML